MLKGSHHTPEARQKMVVANLARSEQHRAFALSQWANPQTRAAMCASMRRDDTCRRGHPRTPENTFIYKNGDRECRPCRKHKRQRIETDFQPPPHRKERRLNEHRTDTGRRCDT